MSSENIHEQLTNFFQRRIDLATKALSQRKSTDQLPVHLSTISSVLFNPRDLLLPGRRESIITIIDQVAAQCGLIMLETQHAWDLPTETRKSLRNPTQNSEPTPPQLTIQPNFREPTVIRGHIPPPTKKRVPDSNRGFGEDPTYTLNDE